MNSDHVAAVLHHPDLVHYDFGPQHPLRPERITLGLDLLHSTGVWDPEADTIEAVPARDSELELVHEADYIRVVQEAGSGWFPGGELVRYGLSQGDNPAFPGMHDAAALVAGGTVQAARAVMGGSVAHAFMPAGGLHHALRARASGFCIYNDPAVAIAVLTREYDARVLYVDLDCHHGDGVQWIFYQDPQVMTVSFHETGRFLFPGTGDVAEIGEGPGRGYSLNVPFMPFTRDRSWTDAVRAVLPAVAESFRPDFLVTNHGADTHVWDPLTHLSLTTEAYFDQVELVHELAHAYASGRWIAVGSGGYDWVGVVPRSWAIVWSEMTGRSLPAQLPVSWLERWGPLAIQAGVSAEALSTFLDSPAISPPSPREAEIERVNRDTVEQALAVASLRRSA